MRIDDLWEVTFPRKFFSKPYQLRLNLDEDGFMEWKEWFFRELVKCPDWTCFHEGESHGVEEVCACSSLFETYRKIADRLLEDDEIDLTFYPMFDPLIANHIPETGWVEEQDGVEMSASEDPIKDWFEWFPKRSCATCSGSRAVLKEKICDHEDEDNCVDRCYKKSWKSWCPIINDFMEKKGWVVNRHQEVKIIENGEMISDEENPSPLRVPKVIRDFLDEAVKKEEEQGNGNGQPNLN